MNTPSEQLLHLIRSNAWAGLVRQQALLEQVGDAPEWELDPSGVLMLNGQRFPATLLGTHSEVSGSWRWGDANADAPASLTAGATGLRAALRKRGAPEADLDQFETSGATPWLMALAAAVELGATASFQCSYDGGSAFVLLEGVQRAAMSPTVLANLIVRFAQVVDAPHRPYFDSEAGAGVVAVRVADAAIAVTFDEAGRVVRVTAG